MTTNQSVSTETDSEIFLQYVISILTLIEQRISSGELQVDYLDNTGTQIGVSQVMYEKQGKSKLSEIA